MEIKLEPLLKFSFYLGRPAYKEEKYLVSEPKPYACRQEDHRQLYYPVREKSRRIKRKPFCWPTIYEITPTRYPLEAINSIGKTPKASPSTRETRLTKALLRKIASIM